MNIGLLSFQRVINHGSFLQAYGLRHMLEDIGHSVTFIDVKLENGKYLNVSSNQSGFAEGLRRFIRPLIKGRAYAYEIEKANRFKEYFKLLGLPEYACTHTKYDAIVIGSDEVFSFAQAKVWGGTLQLFGEDMETNCIISYSASFGYTTYETLKKMNIERRITELLENFKCISVRDSYSADTVEKLTGKRPIINLDPVLIYHFINTPQRIKYNRYILIYSYTDRLCEPQYIKKIKHFAKINGLMTVAAGGYLSWCNHNVQADPFELLAYVQRADYVISETFHGIVYSIKYQKRFAAIVRDSNKNKISGLLSFFGLTDRIVGKDNRIEQILSKQYDEERVRWLIQKEKINAYQYLTENLPVTNTK